jgi:hypothetical protein
VRRSTPRAKNNSRRAGFPQRGNAPTQGGDGMKVGFNLLLWTAHVQREHWPILEDLKRTGYDGVEIPVFEGEPAH